MISNSIHVLTKDEKATKVLSFLYHLFIETEILSLPNKLMASAFGRDEEEELFVQTTITLGNLASQPVSTNDALYVVNDELFFSGAQLTSSGNVVLPNPIVGNLFPSSQMDFNLKNVTNAGRITCSRLTANDYTGVNLFGDFEGNIILDAGGKNYIDMNYLGNLYNGNFGRFNLLSAGNVYTPIDSGNLNVLHNSCDGTLGFNGLTTKQGVHTGFFGSSNLGSSVCVGSKSNSKLRIGTNNTTRILVNDNGNVDFMNNTLANLHPSSILKGSLDISFLNVNQNKDFQQRNLTNIDVLDFNTLTDNTTLGNCTAATLSFSSLQTSNVNEGIVIEPSSVGANLSPRQASNVLRNNFDLTRTDGQWYSGTSTSLTNANVHIHKPSDAYAFECGDITNDRSFCVYPSSSTSSVQVGTHGNCPLDFFTNNGSPSMRLDTSGHLGIGTLAGSFPLNVWKNQQAVASFRGSSYCFVELGDIAAPNYYAGNAGYMAYSDNAGNPYIAWGHRGIADIMYLNLNNQSVGIGLGTSNPSSKLQVSGEIGMKSGSNAVLLTTDGAIEILRASGSPYIDFKDNAADDWDNRLLADSINFTLLNNNTSDGSTLKLDSTNATGGHAWRLISNKSANTNGAGYFQVYDATTNKACILVDGTNGDMGVYRFINDEQYYSDERLKTNIQPFAGVLDIFEHIGFYQYDKQVPSWDDAGGLRSSAEHYGVLAQELERVLPDFVEETVSGYKGVRKNWLFEMCIGGIKELHAKVKALEEKLSNK